MNLADELQVTGKTMGLTIEGALVVMPQEDAATAATQAIANALTNAFTPIGTHLPAEGGTLGAIIARRDGSTYGLIVADASREFKSTWGATDLDVHGAKGPCGATNTRAMAAAGCTVAKTAKTYCIAGHSDWFIPSRLEMLALYEASPELLSKDAYYWTSSQSSRYYAWIQDFEYGSSHGGGKASERRVRPVRSIQLHPFTPSTLVAAGDSREILGTEAAA